jgi:2-methylcitrate dehydratase PrpD
MAVNAISANPGVSEALARLVSKTRYEALPAATVEMTKRCLLDAVGVTLAASTLGEGCAAFVELALEQGGVSESCVIGYRRKLPALMAAFANGAMAHALDFEDTHERSLLHPNAAAVPAALAVAQALGQVSGKELLVALAVGCEVVCRLGDALRVGLDEYGWYPPPILGAFGATAAAGRLYGLDTRQMLDAFSLTLNQATCSAEIKHSPLSLVRGVRDAFAAKAGVLSAQLARKGVRGFDAPFEGEAGFFALYARGQYDPDAIGERLGEHFAVESISFKPWPSCRGTHACIELALDLAQRHRLRPERIARVRVFGPPLARMLAEPLQHKRRPSTAIDAKFSIPFTVATALRHGAVALQHFTQDCLQDEAVLELAARVDFESLPAASSAESASGGALVIETHAGETHRGQVAAPYGHPQHPMSLQALLAKFEDCARHARSELLPESLRVIADRALSIEQLDDVSEQFCALL